MTYCSTYIGDLDDTSFEWDVGDWNGNIPGRIGPEFPYAPKHYNAIFHEWVGISGVTSKQTDFDGWVARVNKQQILDYIEYCYGADVTADLEKLLWFVNTLDDSKQYGLVAECY
jgi:hypothetical protein